MCMYTYKTHSLRLLKSLTLHIACLWCFTLVLVVDFDHIDLNSPCSLSKTTLTLISTSSAQDQTKSKKKKAETKDQKDQQEKKGLSQTKDSNMHLSKRPGQTKSKTKERVKSGAESEVKDEIKKSRIKVSTKTPTIINDANSSTRTIPSDTKQGKEEPKSSMPQVKKIIKTTYRRFFKGSDQDVIRLFAPQFTQVISPQQILKLKNAFTTQLGAFLTLYKVENTPNLYTVVMEKGRIPSRLTLNQKNQIIGLWFGAVEVDVDESTPDYFLNEFKSLPNMASVFIMDQNQKEVLAYNEDLPLAVGSAFKIFVLRALDLYIKRSGHSMNQVVSIKDSLKSLPSGFLHTWPNNTPITLATLAHLMISQSDNTATDHLISYIGRTYLEQQSPTSLIPFLSTREFFVLKWGTQTTLLRQQFIKGEEKEKREVLNKLSAYPLTQVQPLTLPSYIDSLEWLVSSRDICKTLFKLKNHPSLQINPGLASQKQWSLRAFKGGSEPGVLNYSHLLQTKDRKKTYCVITTVNHLTKTVDRDAFDLLVQKVFGWLYKESQKVENNDDELDEVPSLVQSEKSQSKPDLSKSQMIPTGDIPKSSKVPQSTKSDISK